MDARPINIKEQVDNFNENYNEEYGGYPLVVNSTDPISLSILISKSDIRVRLDFMNALNNMTSIYNMKYNVKLSNIPGIMSSFIYEVNNSDDLTDLVKLIYNSISDN